MYSKLFASMYDGTIVDAGWEAIVTFQQLIILSDPHGVVDMTPEAISRRTTIPLQIIQKGLAILALPDQNSRSPAADGRRIVLIDEDRPWGWQIVNFVHYRDLRTQADRRDYMRDYMKRKRTPTVNKDDVLTPVSSVSPRIRKTHTHTHTQEKQEAPCTPAMRAPVIPDWMPADAWANFVAHRARLRKPMTDRARELLIGKLEDLRHRGHDPATLIDTAIERGWQTVFEPRAEAPVAKASARTQANFDAYQTVIAEMFPNG